MFKRAFLLLPVLLSLAACTPNGIEEVIADTKGDSILDQMFNYDTSADVLIVRPQNTLTKAEDESSNINGYSVQHIVYTRNPDDTTTPIQKIEFSSIKGTPVETLDESARQLPVESIAHFSLTHPKAEMVYTYTEVVEEQWHDVEEAIFVSQAQDSTQAYYLLNCISHAQKHILRLRFDFTFPLHTSNEDILESIATHILAPKVVLIKTDRLLTYDQIKAAALKSPGCYGEWHRIVPRYYPRHLS